MAGVIWAGATFVLAGMIVPIGGGPHGLMGRPALDRNGCRKSLVPSHVIAQTLLTVLSGGYLFYIWTLALKRQLGSRDLSLSVLSRSLLSFACHGF